MQSPTAQRQQLLSTVRTLTEQMDAGKYEAARATIATLKSNIRESLKSDYETTAGEPTRAELLAAVADARPRIGSIRSAARERTGTTTETATETTTDGDAASSADINDGLPLVPIGAGVAGAGVGTAVLLRWLFGDSE